MPTSLIYKWNNNQAYTDDFQITTKYYDLGSTVLNKNVYSISITFGPDNSSFNMQNALGQSLAMQLMYRTNINDEFRLYSMLNPVSVNDYTTSTPISTVTKEIKLKNIPGIQLKILAAIPEKFIINDISIEYRILRRDKSVARPQ